MNLAKLLVAIGATTTGFQRGISAAERRLEGLEKRTHGARRAFGGATRSLTSFAKKAMLVGTVTLALLTAGLLGVVNASIQYEDAFAGVRKTVEATEPQLNQLSKDIRKMSTEIPMAATELAGLAETAGALGVPTKNIKEFVRVTAMIGLTTNVSADQAADALGRLGNILGLTADDYSKFASALVALGNAGASTEAEIIEITKRMGAAGKLAGLTTPQIIGWASAIASVTGLEPERGGTAFQSFLVNVTKFTSKMTPKLKLMAATAGMSAKSFKKLFGKDANGALLAFITGLDKLSKGKRLAVLAKLGVTDSGQIRALLGLASSHKEVARQLGISTKEYEKNLAMQAEFDKRMATTKSQLSLLGNILLDLGMTLGDILLPLITPMIKGINDWVKANRPLIDQLIKGIANGIVTIVTGISTWIGQNKGLIIQVGTTLFDALSKIWTVITTQVIPALFGTGGKGGIIPGVIELGTKVADWLIPKVSAFIDTLTKPGGVIDSIMKVAGPTIGALLEGFGFIITALFGGGKASRSGAKHHKGLIPAIGDLVGVLWDDGKSPLATALRLIGWAFKVIAERVGKMIDALADLVDWIGKHTKEIGDFLGMLGELGKVLPGAAGLNLPKPGNIPGNAKGGRAPRGIGWVGEEGPELVNWRRPAYVTPADLSSEVMASAAGEKAGDTNITIINPEPKPAEDDIAFTLRRLELLGAA